MKARFTTKRIQAWHDKRKLLKGRVSRTDDGLTITFGPRSSTWSVFYRVRGTTTARNHKLGEYPDLDLDAARDLATAIKRKAAKGDDVVIEEQQRIEAEKQQVLAEALRVQSSFAIAVRDYLVANAHRSAAGLQNTRFNLAFATAAFGALPLNQVTKAIITPVYNARTADGKYASNATYTDLRALFAWCVKQGRLERSPMEGLGKPHKTRSRDVYLEADELRAVLLAARDEEYPFGRWIEMVVATAGQRRSDISRMRWKDIGPIKLKQLDPLTNELIDVQFDWVWKDFDPTKPQVDDEGKKQRIHYVPLNTMAQRILKACPRFLHGEFVFSGSGGKTQFSGYSRAMKRLRKAAGITTHWSPHVLRHSAATLLADHCGALPDEVAMLQNRTSAYLRGAEKVYQHSVFLRRKQRLLDDWSTFLDALLKDTDEKSETKRA